MASQGRRTQEERSAETRARLMAAAVDCLLEKGYAGTSIGEIHERAQVARGTLLHHFPTKAGLIAAAVTHLVDQRIGRATRAVADLPEGSDRLDAVVELVWGDLTSDAFYAGLELWVGGRTDPDLREALLREQPRLLRVMQTGLEDVLRVDHGGGSRTAALSALTFQALTGLSLTTLLAGRPADAEPMVRVVKRVLRVLLGELTADELIESPTERSRDVH